jgi:hypothetical protein
LDWDKIELIGENLPEFELMGEPSPSGGFYIKCHDCVDACNKSKGRKKWTQNTERKYKEQHDAWLKERKEAEHQLEQTVAAVANANNALKNERLPTPEPPEQREEQVILLDNETDLPSPPALTDNSLPTPAMGSSRVSTPKLMEPQQQKKVPARAKRYASGNGFSETRYEKKARLNAQA